MRNDVKKINFTLRMKKEVSDAIEENAKSLGLSKNGYINMILHNSISRKWVK